jgi:hypothetical protein
MSSHSSPEFPGFGATFDPTGVYRYHLWRVWDEDAPRVAFVMLNPSTADARQDDPTLRRCLGFARAWGYGTLDVVNLFALRATDPNALRHALDPIGPDNDIYIQDVTRRADLVVAAWGNRGILHNRDRQIGRLLAGLPILCLGLTDQGHPRHPLYVKNNAVCLRLTG